jgi:hypothetical protein
VAICLSTYSKGMNGEQVKEDGGHITHRLVLHPELGIYHHKDEEYPVDLGHPGREVDGRGLIRFEDV